MNVENVQKLADAFEHRIRDDQVCLSVYMQFAPGRPDKVTIHDAMARCGVPEEAPCGTEGCVAGWAVALLGDATRTQHSQSAFQWYAQELLGLEDHEASYLFFNWPSGRQSRADVVARLRQMAATHRCGQSLSSQMAATHRCGQSLSSQRESLLPPVSR